MKLSELNVNPANPREISERSKGGLHASMTQFGDISGIVYNNTTKQLVGGHQRQSVLLEMFGEDPEIEMLKEFKKPTEDGTVGIGALKTKNGQHFSVRFVEWDANKEASANLTANNTEITGYFDVDKLPELVAMAREFGGFDTLLLEDLSFNINVLDPVSEQIKEEATELGGGYSDESTNELMNRGILVSVRDGIFEDTKKKYLHCVAKIENFDLLFSEFIENEYTKSI